MSEINDPNALVNENAQISFTVEGAAENAADPMPVAGTEPAEEPVEEPEAAEATEPAEVTEVTEAPEAEDASEATEATEPAEAEEAAEATEAPVPTEAEEVDEQPADEPQDDGIAAILAAIAELQKKFDDKIAYDEFREKQIDKLHAELQAYKEDLQMKLLKPFVKGILALINEYSNFAEKIVTGQVDGSRVTKWAIGVSEDLNTLLEDCDMELYNDEESDVFNPRTQRVKKTIDTTDPALDKHIAARIRPGYRWRGIMMQPEFVHIYKYKE